MIVIMVEKAGITKDEAKDFKANKYRKSASS
jgi:hypothetical protein